MSLNDCGGGCSCSEDDCISRGDSFNLKSLLFTIDYSKN